MTLERFGWLPLILFASFWIRIQLFIGALHISAISSRYASLLPFSIGAPESAALLREQIANVFKEPTGELYNFIVWARQREFELYSFFENRRAGRGNRLIQWVAYEFKVVPVLPQGLPQTMKKVYLVNNWMFIEAGDISHSDSDASVRRDCLKFVSTVIDSMGTLGQVHVISSDITRLRAGLEKAREAFKPIPNKKRASYYLGLIIVGFVLVAALLVVNAMSVLTLVRIYKWSMQSTATALLFWVLPALAVWFGGKLIEKRYLRSKNAKLI